MFSLRTKFSRGALAAPLVLTWPINRLPGVQHLVGLDLLTSSAKLPMIEA